MPAPKLPPLTPAQQKLVAEGRDLVEAVVAKYMARFRRGDREELVAEGSVGLVEAAQRYDGAAGASFETFARRRIDGAIVDYLRRELPHLRGMAAAYRAASDYLGAPHDPVDSFASDEQAEERMTQIAEGLAASLFAAYTMAQARDAEEAYMQRDALARARAALEDAVAELPERDQLLVRRRFHDGVELVVVAEELGTPYRTAKRRYASILYQLGKALNRRGIEAPSRRASG